MYMLAGLMGMMALGSVAIAGAGLLDQEDVAEDDDLLDETEVDDAPRPDPEVAEDGRSLFARMGLINMPGMADGSSPAVSDVETDGGPLLLEAFLVDPSAGPDTPEIMEFDAEEEQLLVIFDDSNGDADPSLDLRVRADDPETTDILVDGVALASLPTAETPPLSSIVLVGESDAATLELG
jgi:hypothetical protein